MNLIESVSLGTEPTLSSDNVTADAGTATEPETSTAQSQQTEAENMGAASITERTIAVDKDPAPSSD